jgi:hypothetical protein
VDGVAMLGLGGSELLLLLVLGVLLGGVPVGVLLIWPPPNGEVMCGERLAIKLGDRLPPVRLALPASPSATSTLAHQGGE